MHNTIMQELKPWGESHFGTARFCLPLHRGLAPQAEGDKLLLLMADLCPPPWGQVAAPCCLNLNYLLPTTSTSQWGQKEPQQHFVVAHPPLPASSRQLAQPSCRFLCTRPSGGEV